MKGLASNTLPALEDYAKARLALAGQRVRPCKVCGSDSIHFDALDFNKVCGPAAAHFAGKSGISVHYRRCQQCEFIFTEFFDDFSADCWVTFIYNSDYYEKIDSDYELRRPQSDAFEVDCMLQSPQIGWVGLDYGGGNGLLGKLLSDKGYIYDSYDPYGANSLKPGNITRYNFCSSFEVFEHTTAPVDLLSDVLRLCSADRLGILIGTQTPDKTISPGELADWWYAAPRNGHISLHSRRSLAALAAKFSLSHFSLSSGTHLMARGYSPLEMRKLLLLGKMRSRARKLLKKVWRRF